MDMSAVIHKQASTFTTPMPLNTHSEMSAVKGYPEETAAT
jgi:hypothetical protein